MGSSLAMKSEAEINILLVDQTIDMLRSFLVDAKEVEKGAIQKKSTTPLTIA